MQTNIYFSCSQNEQMSHRLWNLHRLYAYKAQHKASSMENKMRHVKWSIGQSGDDTGAITYSSNHLKQKNSCSSVLFTPTVTKIKLYFSNRNFIGWWSQLVWVTEHLLLHSCGWQKYTGRGSPGRPVWVAPWVFWVICRAWDQRHSRSASPLGRSLGWGCCSSPVEACGWDAAIHHWQWGSGSGTS